MKPQQQQQQYNYEVLVTNEKVRMFGGNLPALTCLKFPDYTTARATYDSIKIVAPDTAAHLVFWNNDTGKTIAFKVYAPKSKAV